MGVASGYGEQEVGVAIGSGWYLWVWLLGVVVRRYIDFIILLMVLHFLYWRRDHNSCLFCSTGTAKVFKLGPKFSSPRTLSKTQ